jgi:ribonuclease-3
LSIKNFLRFYFSSEKDLRKAIKNIFGFYPGNIFLYKLALRHKSASIRQKGGIKINNERLEYLGDAILSAVIADYLFKHFPYKDEGFLTEMRSKIVSRASLNRLSHHLGIKNYMMISSKDGRIMKSVGGNAFEAFIGALYLDKGYAFTYKIMVKRIIKMHFDMDQLEASEISYKGRLIEWAQKEKRELHFSLIKEEVVQGRSQFEVEVQIDNKAYAKALDFSIKGAENLAAEKTWGLLQNDLSSSH